MRSVTVEIDGQSIDMPVSYAAGTALAKAGFDPLAMAIKASNGESSLDSLGVIEILYLGVKHAGEKLTREQVGNAVYEGGVGAFAGVATGYLAAFVTAGPEHPVKAPGEA